MKPRELHKACVLIPLLVAPVLTSPAAEAPKFAPLPEVKSIRRLPVTTGAIGNTLIRGHTFTDKSQTWMQLYTSDLAVSAEGFVFLTTPWEEGLRAAGIYKDGDALPEMTGLGVNSGEAVAVSARHVACARWLNSKDGRRKEVVVFERAAGAALNSATKRTIYLPEQKLTITGLALDESRDRLYCADDEGVSALTLSSGKLVPGFRIALPRAGKLELDAQGNLWVVQRAALGKAREEIAAQVFSSEPLDAAHGAEQAVLDSGDEKIFFAAKDTERGFVGLDFGKPVGVAHLRLQGDMGKERFAELRVQGSVAGRDGPWTDLASFADKPYAWPEEWLTLDAAKPLRCLRIIGPNLVMKRLRAFAMQAKQPGRMLKFDPDGRALPQVITGVEQPNDIAFDAKRDRLLVAGAWPEHQVHAFAKLDAAPALDETFGVRGKLGAAGGWRSERGRMGEARFENLRGVGVDAVGNVFVCSVGAGMCQSALESYTPQGAFRWRLEGTSFLDAVDADPASPGDLFSVHNRYRVTPDGDARWLASIVDVARFPDDPRLNGTALTYGVRRLHGRKFLITTSQHATPLCVFRFTEDDEAAIPCGLISPRHTAKAWPPHQPLGFGGFLWRDRDGDGQFDAGEYDKARRDDSEMMFPNVDDAGDLWFFTRIQGKRFLRKLALAPQLDAHGSPVWNWDAPGNALYALPPPLDDPKSRFGGFEVDGARGEVFLFGFPADQPNECGMNWPLGRLVQRCRPEGDRLVATHGAKLLHNVTLVTKAKDQAYGAALGGEYLFVAYAQHFTVLVYRRADLALVGRLDLGPQVLAPLMDGSPELIVRPDGDGFVLHTPHYVANAVHRWHWNGKLTGWMPAPVPELKDNELKWDEVAGATGWLIEKRALEPRGWSAWASAGKLPAAARSWRDPQAGADSSAYRLRALGNGGAQSDWSRTIYRRK